jgi:AraC-like DNA-binding protein
MDIKFQNVIPVQPLRGYIEKIWVFESSQPMPNDDMKLVVPNGRLLLVIPFRNGLIGKMDNRHHFAKTNKMALVGMADRASIVDAETSGPTGTIGIEISPRGAYRFFHIRLKDIKNELQYLTDVLGETAKEIEEKIAEQESIRGKIYLLQQFLLSLFLQSEEDALFEFCLQRITASEGHLRISDLEHQTGYSSRWLNMKFEERLGVSPKTFTSIVRFQPYYRALLSNSVDFLRQKQFYAHYHDESHFIKDFQKFTGLSPTKLVQSANKFGRTFYEA